MKHMLWLSMALMGPAASQPASVTFHTFPAAQVYLVNDEASGSSQDEVLGNSNQSLTIDFSKHSSRPWTIYFLPPGARPGQSAPLAKQTLYPGALRKSGHYPEDQSPIQLPLTGPQRLLLMVRQPWPYLAVGLLGLGAWGALRVRRSRAGESSATIAAVGAWLGRYQLISSLGRGGHGEVFRACNDVGEEVAVKVLRGDLGQDGSHEKRFLREIQICSRLNHPNLIRIHDWGQQEDLLYLVLELLQGETLNDRLRGRGLTPAEVAQLLSQLGEALQTLHNEGLVHRDIKPDNLFLLHNGTVKLMDFGIARSQDLTQATQTGFALGTPAYMSPEQIQGQLDPASDQYSLGVVAFLCLTGQKPFDGDDAMAVAYQQVNQIPPLPSKINPALSREVDTVISRMLAKNPRARYAKIKEACGALSQALRSEFQEDATTEVAF